MSDNLHIYYSRQIAKLYDGSFGITKYYGLRVGDIIDYDTFVKIGNISALGIKYTEFIDDENANCPIISSDGLSKTEIKAGVDEIAKVCFSFTNANSFYLETRHTQIVKIKEDDEKGTLGKKIINLYERPSAKWKKNWMVVTEVTRVKKFILIVSKSRNARISIETSNLNDWLDAGFEFNTESNIGFKDKSEKGDNSFKSIMFRGKHVETNILGHPRFVEPRTRGEGFNNAFLDNWIPETVDKSSDFVMLEPVKPN